MGESRVVGVDWILHEVCVLASCRVAAQKYYIPFLSLVDLGGTCKETRAAIDHYTTERLQQGFSHDCFVARYHVPGCICLLSHELNFYQSSLPRRCSIYTSLVILDSAGSFPTGPFNFWIHQLTVGRL